MIGHKIKFEKIPIWSVVLTFKSTTYSEHWGD
jgi:hypothetical protein